MKPSVFVAMPRYGSVEPESRIAAFVQATDGDVDVTVSDRCSSLLANSFNHAWCECVNAKKHDFFCLIHADIAPSGMWLDIMVEECEEFDVLHVPVAIKDQRGTTSTAVGQVEDEWARVRRITVHELLQMPMTFGAEEIGVEPGWCLLPNTGLFLVKLAPWSRRMPGFTIKDRIVNVSDSHGVLPADHPDAPDHGTLHDQVVPEDWGFGRWCATQGLRVGATRKVNVDHIGRATYPNYAKFGIWTRDEYFFGGQNGKSSGHLLGVDGIHVPSDAG